MGYHCENRAGSLQTYPQLLPIFKVWARNSSSASRDTITDVVRTPVRAAFWRGYSVGCRRRNKTAFFCRCFEAYSLNNSVYIISVFVLPAGFFHSAHVSVWLLFFTCLSWLPPKYLSAESYLCTSSELSVVYRSRWAPSWIVFTDGFFRCH